MYARTRLGFADIARLGQIEGWRNHERLRQLCRDKGLTGNDLPDAWLMAAFAQRGEHPVSFDRGFKKLIGRAQFTLPVGNAESKGADRCLVADLLQARAIGAQFDAVVWILADVDV